MSKQHGYKLILFMAILALLTAGCSSKQPADAEQGTPSNTQAAGQEPGASNTQDTAGEDPFESGGNTIVMGSIGHTFINPELDEKGDILPLHYNGGELEIEYSVNASGKARNVGFLVFIDGVPQPYKVDSTSAPYEYMHVFELEEDNRDTPFTFLFTPVTGKKGDALHVSIASVYNPTFMPDMKETTSYGGYQTTLEAGRELVFNQDPDALDTSSIPGRELLGQVSLTAEPVTKDLMEKHSAMGEVNMETLDKQVFSELYINGAEHQDNLKIEKDGKLQVTFKLFGHPGVKYRNTFYINHEALKGPGGTSFETVLKKGEVAVIEAELDAGQLEDLNTFYIVSVPVNAADFPNDVVVLQKTASLLLYK